MESIVAGKINVVLPDGNLAFCKVIENLGYNHDAGAYCKIVELDGREVLVKRPQGLKLWRPHTAAERVAPVLEWLERRKREANQS
jgi:hypothetical protein